MNLSVQIKHIDRNENYCYEPRIGKLSYKYLYMSHTSWYSRTTRADHVLKGKAQHKSELSLGFHFMVVKNLEKRFGKF